MTPNDPASVRQWCRTYLAQTMKLPPAQIGDTATFTSLGMDSAELLFMVAALEQHYKLDLASDTTTEFPTVESLAEFIAAELAAKSPRR